jgi:transcription termination factor Rho
MVDEGQAGPPTATEEQGQPRGARRSRPRRRRGQRGSRSSAAAVPVRGYLLRRDDGRACLVTGERGFRQSPHDPLVDPAIVTTYNLETGLLLEGYATPGGGGRRPLVVPPVTIEGMSAEAYRAAATPFGELVSIDPLERFRLETDPEVVEPRVVELIAPIGKGQRCLIVAPPKAGKTVLLQQLAHAIAVNHPETIIFVLLVDERPEEVTEWKRSVVRGEVHASSSDESTESHIEISEMLLERARRLVEMGRDVVIFMDSLTRMSRAYNNQQKGSGRILSGGIDARTMEKPRRFFGSARNIEGGGSLTIIATCLVDTGSRMDEVIFQEFKGTGNMEITLTRELFERRIFPCMAIAESGTRKEEKLFTPEEVEKVRLLRRALAPLPAAEAMQALTAKLRQMKTNAEFLASIKAGNGR